MHGLHFKYLASFFVLCSLLSGCPATTEPASEDNNVVDAPEGPCDPTLVFASCSGASCHEGRDGMPPAGGVELFSPGFEQNLVDVEATYPKLTDCPDPPEYIINSNDPEESLFITKLRDTQKCGIKMPPEPLSLTEDEIACVEDWVLHLAVNGTAGL